MYEKLSKKILTICLVIIFATTNLFLTTLVGATAGQSIPPQLPLCDVAVNKPVYVSSEKGAVLTNSETTGAFYSAAYIVDNIDSATPELSYGYESFWSPEDSDMNPSAVIDLTIPYVVHRMDVQVAGGNKFKITASTDNITYNTIESYRNLIYGSETTTLYYNIEPCELAEYRYFKIEKLEGSTGDFKVMDFKAYAPSVSTSAEYELLSAGKDVVTNLAEIERSAGGPPATLNPNVLTDGLITNYSTFHTAGIAPRVTIDLGEGNINKTIRRVEFTARGQAAGTTYWYPDSRVNFEAWATDSTVGGLNSTAEEIQASGTKIGEFKPTTSLAFGPPYATIAYDTNLTGKRYVTLIGVKHIAEIRIFGDNGTSAPVTAPVVNIMSGKPSANASADSQQETANLIDGNNETSWTANSNTSFVTYDLGAYYNVKKVAVVADATTPSAKSNFAIYGGMSSLFNNDCSLLTMQGNEPYIGDKFEKNVFASNVVKYITLKSTAVATAPQKFAELQVLCIENDDLVNVALNKPSSISTINNENLSSTEAPYPEGVANMADGVNPPTFWIDLGEKAMPINKVKFYTRNDLNVSKRARNFKIVGSNNINGDYVELAKTTNQAMPIYSSIVFEIKTSISYRYIAVVKDPNNQLSGGTFNFANKTPGVPGASYDSWFFPYNNGCDGENHLYVPEILVFAYKPETFNIAPLGKIDKGGEALIDCNKTTLYSGQDVVLDLGKNYAISSVKLEPTGSADFQVGTNGLEFKAFTPGDYRYVKLLKKAPNEAITNLAEVYVFVEKVATDAKILLKDVAIQDSKTDVGNPVSNLKYPALGIRSQLINLTSESKDVVVLFSLYSDEGKLVKTSLKSQAIPGNSTAEITTGFDNDVNSIKKGYKVRAMYWNDVQNMSPYLKYQELVQP